MSSESKIASPSLEYFKDPETSFFKTWFNSSHVMPKEESKEAYHKFVLDFLIYWAAHFGPPDPLMEELSNEQRKLRNDIAAFELSCWYLSYLDFWLVDNDHLDRKKILTNLVYSLALISQAIFQLSVDELNSQIINRMTYYHKFKNFEEIASEIFIQMSWGFRNKRISLDVPCKGHELPNLDIEFLTLKPALVAWTTTSYSALAISWERALLHPVCKK